MFSISEIKRRSKSQLNHVLGKAILATIIFIVVNAVVVGGLTYYQVNSANPVPLIPSIVQGLVGVFLSIGYFKIMFDLVRGKEMSINIFSAGGKSFLRYLLYSIIKNIIVGLVSLILIFILFMSVGIGLFFSRGESIADVVTGIGVGSVTFGFIILLILFAFNVFIAIIYCFTPFFILLKEEEVDTITSMRYSRSIVRGSFWRIILFNISFIGWYILMIIPPAIGASMGITNLDFRYALIGFVISAIIGLYFVPYYTASLSNLFLTLLKQKSDRINTQIIINPDNMTLFSDGEYEDLGSCRCGSSEGEVSKEEGCGCGDDCGCGSSEGEVSKEEGCGCGDDCGCGSSEGEVSKEEGCGCGDDCGCGSKEDK